MQINEADVEKLLSIIFKARQVTWSTPDMGVNYNSTQFHFYIKFINSNFYLLLFTMSRYSEYLL